MENEASHRQAGPIQHPHLAIHTGQPPYLYTSCRAHQDPLTASNVGRQSNLTDQAKSLVCNHNNREELLGTAQQLFQIPEQEQLPAALMMMFTGLQEVASGMASQPTPPPPPSAMRSDPFKTPQSLRVFIRSNIRQILLELDLQAYGHKPGAKSHGVKSPFTLIKELINAQDDCFHTTNLPPNWRNDLQDVNELDTLITNILKAKKSFLGRIIKVGLVDNKKAPALPLAELVVMYPLVTNAVKARLAKVTKRPQHFGIRLMMTLPHVETRKLSSDLPSRTLLSQPKPKSSQR
ncbi:uncharacterized protein VP01_5847g2 [Puccinia sorghi]|uniref:Uncharacterized protein n=1 Tax=Puccinia sorghi TaxID=27349 RepID=A0A0L6UIS9_9BASI|nr:uncharacterized protein VP01_5847g2 [Puccinia sorghi]